MEELNFFFKSCEEMEEKDGIFIFVQMNNNLKLKCISELFESRIIYSIDQEELINSLAYNVN